MKVLFLLRDPAPGLRRAAEELAEGLRDEGTIVETYFAEQWMPKQTGPKVDKIISPRLAELVKPYDLVHAWGYRTAWACGEALKTNKKWVFTAYQPPKTTHPDLIDRLSTCRYALCCSKMVGAKLLRAGVDGCKTIFPGVNLVDHPVDREAAREQMGWDPERSYVGIFDGPDVDHAMIDAAFERTKSRVGDAELVYFSENEPHPRETLFGAVDLLLFPQANKGFSMTLLDAMNHGTACIVHEFSGLSEVIEDRYSGLVYEDPEALGDVLASALQMSLRTDGMREQARERIRVEFARELYIQRVLRLYDKVMASGKSAALPEKSG